MGEHLPCKQGVKKMCIRDSYSPSLTRPEEFMDKVREIFPRAKAAKDAWTAELEFDED